MYFILFSSSKLQWRAIESCGSSTTLTTPSHLQNHRSQDSADRRSTGVWTRRWSPVFRCGSRISTTGYMSPKPTKTPRLGWSVLDAPNPRSLGWWPNCGPSPQWHGLQVSKLRLLASPAWLIRVRAPFGATWTATTSSGTRSRTGSGSHQSC